MKYTGKNFRGRTVYFAGKYSPKTHFTVRNDFLTALRSRRVSIFPVYGELIERDTGLSL